MGAQLTDPIPGYGTIPFEVLLNMQEDPGDPGVARARIHSFMSARDGIAILAKAGQQLLIELLLESDGEEATGSVDQPSVELLQAYLLVFGRGPLVPASPTNVGRLWKLLKRDLRARQGPPLPAEASALERLTREARVRTTFYRNIFNSDDAAEIVPALLSRTDQVSVTELGYRVSDLARALFTLLNETVERLYQHRDLLRVFFSGWPADVDLRPAFAGSPLATKLWSHCSTSVRSDAQRGHAAFQVAEMACEQLFRWDRGELAQLFGAEVTDALFGLAITPGNVSDEDLSGIHLDNPVWRKPFVRQAADTLLLPLPGLTISFPFAIVEQAMAGSEPLRAAYSKARASYLEDEVARIITEALPSARIYRGVEWVDPQSNVRWEHDLVAVLGNHVMIFEAKAGRLKDAARRGGGSSLLTNFRELFVAPGEQARRLRELLARGPAADGLLKDRSRQPVEIDLNTPSIVCMFGVCIEHLAALTSSKKRYVDLGLADENTPWAPVLSLGELRMILARLDTEVSFFHYLTRRATLDEVMTFSGDEQDLLAMYLTNGFNISGLDPGTSVMLHRADGLVRGKPPQAGDRTRFETIGIKLSPWWRLVGAEIYSDAGSRHRFDMIETLLNQHPDVLAGLEARTRRWRSGGGLGAGNTGSGRVEIGNRVFVVAVYMAKHMPVDPVEWRTTARFIAGDLGEKLQATDCMVILQGRKTRTVTFDGISFFRFPAG